MTDTRTPGAVAYGAYRAWALETYAPSYDRLPTYARAGWEAAAQAVRAQDTGGAAPARATARQQQWAKALHLLVEHIRQLPHEPDIASGLEEVWVMLHTLREAEDTHA